MELRVGLSLFFFGSILMLSKSQPLINFSFDNKATKDNVSNLEPKLVNVSFTEDRFGNTDHALHLFGNANSYVNLGTSHLLKPKSGSISIWVKIENALWYGTGYNTNPILLTKRSTGDDFFEAYAIYYMFETKKVSALCTKDSTNQVFFYSKQNFELQTWQHLVFAYDKDTAYFYINGQLENKFKTGFEIEFLEEDSVLVGVTANEKNNRFFSGAIDDIQFFNKVLHASEVLTLYNAPNPNRFNLFRDRILKAIFSAFVLGLIYIFIRYRIEIQMNREREKLELQTKLLETELRVNRALMNPHFIFNSLNSIRNLILNNQNDEANAYLLKFSKLMRKILEGNISESITLTDEVDILTRYLELEQLRFQTNFSYTITAEDPTTNTQIRLPIMMIQPFVENAIWHGLMNKKGERLLNISFTIQDEKYLFCVVDDNGLGRIQKENVFKNRKSMAIIFVRSRLELINKIHNLDCKLEIIDKQNASGTRVEITLPILT